MPWKVTDNNEIVYKSWTIKDMHLPLYGNKNVYESIYADEIHNRRKFAVALKRIYDRVAKGDWDHKKFTKVRVIDGLNALLKDINFHVDYSYTHGGDAWVKLYYDDIDHIKVYDIHEEDDYVGDRTQINVGVCFMLITNGIVLKATLDKIEDSIRKNEMEIQNLRDIIKNFDKYAEKEQAIIRAIESYKAGMPERIRLSGLPIVAYY